MTLSSSARWDPIPSAPKRRSLRPRAASGMRSHLRQNKPWLGEGRPGGGARAAVRHPPRRGKRWLGKRSRLRVSTYICWGTLIALKEGRLMQLSAVLLARVVAFIETFDLTPRGGVYYPDLVEALVRRYGFQKFPQRIEEFDETKGVEFLTGRDGDKVIERFVIWNTLLLLETRSSTDDSKDILERALSWGEKEFRLAYRPGMVKRWAYVSNITFETDFPLLASVSGPLRKLSLGTTNALAEAIGERLDYEPTVITLTHDQLARKYGLAGLTIQRRVDAPFSDNKYFSEAPLPTQTHIHLLEAFEADVRSALAAQ